MIEDAMNKHTFRKAERLNSTKQIEALFKSGKSFVAYPLRAIYLIRKEERQDCAPVNILISVPKKKFKRAVKRNRVKRLVREAYRLNRTLLYSILEGKENIQVDMALIYLKEELPSYAEMEVAMLKLADELSKRVKKE